MTFKAILFDFGGVLLRTQNQEPRRNWEIKLGIGEGDLSKLVFNSEIAYQATVGTAPVKAVWDHVSEILKLDNFELEKLQSDFWKADQLDLVLVDYLATLHKSFITGILSNAWLNGRKIISEMYHLDRFVDEIIISSEVGLAKPDSRIYKLAANQIKVEPEEILLIDDFIENVMAANKSGMQAIHFTGTQELMNKVDRLIQE